MNIKFRLPGKIEQCLAALSSTYAASGERLLQEIVVNAKPTIEEGEEFDGLDGGIHGHSLTLSIPGAIFIKAVKIRKKLQDRIHSDLAAVHNVRREYFCGVLLEAENDVGSDWRTETGLLLSGQPVPSQTAQTTIWGTSGFRVFLSHRSAYKANVSKLKESLEKFGASCFVAHNDIKPTKQWETEMRNGLATMDFFVALMTGDFHASEWTDQEAGYAVARGVPTVSVDLGLKPYGFLGKFQALSSSWENAADDLLPLLLEHERMVGAYVQAVKDCASFDFGNRLANAFPHIRNLGDAEVDTLIEAYNGNSQLQGSYGFDGTKPSKYGKGLLHYLNEWSPRTFVFDGSRIIDSIPP